MQPSLLILPPIDHIREIQRQLHPSKLHVIHRLHAQHEAMILIRNLILPAPEPAPAVDTLRSQLG